MNELTGIILATLAGGVLSVAAAALLSLTLLGRVASRMTSFSVGVLLAAALINLLPEALETLKPDVVGGTLLAGLLTFFVLEKLALWRHDHSQEASTSSPAGLMIVLGDGVHNFADGVLIAAAFLQSPALGVTTAIAVIAHEVPQEVGDFMILLDSGYSKRRALLLNTLSSLAAVAGGVLGWLALSHASGVVPYVLCVAAASFLYVAVADLMPALQRFRRPPDFAVQLALAGTGIGIVLFGKH